MICEKTGKFIYQSKAIAYDIIQRKSKTRKTKRSGKHSVNLDTKMVSTYKCEYCGKYHIAGKRKIKAKHEN